MTDRTHAAAEVADAIIGRGYDPRHQSRRSLEAAVASWVIDALEIEGHRVTDLWSPDRDRARRSDRKTRPELAMDLDGVPAALDVTRFTTNLLSAGLARVFRVREAVVPRLLDLDRVRDVHAVVTYDPAAIMGRSRRQFADDTRRLADGFEMAVKTVGAVDGHHDLATLPPWSSRARLNVHGEKSTPPTVGWAAQRKRLDVPGEVDAAISESFTKKRNQMTPWGRSILVIAHGRHETADDVRAGFARTGPTPWWRVYWAGPAPEHVELVASQPQDT